MLLSNKHCPWLFDTTLICKDYDDNLEFFSIAEYFVEKHIMNNSKVTKVSSAISKQRKISQM
jgi:hypothetical protein